MPTLGNALTWYWLGARVHWHFSIGREWIEVTNTKVCSSLEVCLSTQRWYWLGLWVCHHCVICCVVACCDTVMRLQTQNGVQRGTCTNSCVPHRPSADTGRLREVIVAQPWFTASPLPHFGRFLLMLKMIMKIMSMIMVLTLWPWWGWIWWYCSCSKGNDFIFRGAKKQNFPSSKTHKNFPDELRETVSQDKPKKHAFASHVDLFWEHSTHSTNVTRSKISFSTRSLNSCQINRRRDRR